MPKKSRVIIGKAVTKAIPNPAGGVRLETFIPWRLIKRNVRREIITPLDAPEQFRVEAGIERRERKAAEETPLVRALGLAYFWMGLMEIGRFKTLKTLSEIAEAEGIHVSRVRDFMRLTLLAPDLIERMLGGTLPRGWNLEFFDETFDSQGLGGAEGDDGERMRRRDMMRLTRLAPDIIEDVLAGRSVWSLDRLMRQGVPKDWEEQRRMVGEFFSALSQMMEAK